MDQHPIPQNVTGFQFKLIGAMTVKQFGYVAAGVIAAVILYYVPLKGLFGVLTKIIFIPLFGAGGALIAFVPVDGRPVDVMASNFMKALLAPNQYIYRKNITRFSFSKIAYSKTVAAPQTQHAVSTPKQKMINERGNALQKLLIKSAQTKIKNPQDAKEAAFLSSITKQPDITMTSSPLIQKAPTALPPLPPKPLTPTPMPTTNSPVPQVLSEKEDALKKQLEFAKKEEATQRDPKEVTLLHQKTVELEKQVGEIHAQKQKLEEEIKNLKNQLLIQKTPVAVIAQAPKQPGAATTKTPVVAAAHVRSVPQEMNKKMGFLVSDTPNVVTGLVKDARGNVLPNILVEIKDKADNPVRAFKTNTLGNFASATPLSAGTYTITLEDPKKQHTFDSIQITASNQIMLPIEIISYDKREQLRKDLFT